MSDHRDSLFYAANFDPEVNRLFKSVQAGDEERMKMFKKITLHTVDNLLKDENLSPGGKYEWKMVQDMVHNFENLNPNQQDLLCRYGAPFSYLFSKQNTL